uniref:RxLR effector candidate protein n=1 Tax=Hyaloperonospora arabidopsidis (strain Emoy2) TaxID=559515 RepID=M4BPF2_HYAAE
MATGEDELKLLEQPLIAKLVGDPEDGVSTSMYSRVADWFDRQEYDLEWRESRRAVQRGYYA